MTASNGQPHDPPPSLVSAASLPTVGLVLFLAGLLLQASPLDMLVFHSLRGAFPAALQVACWLSVLGLGIATLTLAGAAGPRGAQWLAAVALSAVVCAGCVQWMHFAVGAHSPVAMVGPAEVQPIGQALHGRSLPSGHSAMWGALFGLVAAAPNRASRRGHQGRRQLGLTLLALLCTSGAFTRIAIGEHGPGELLAGLGLGLMVGAAVTGTRPGRLTIERLTVRLLSRPGSRLVAAGMGLLSGMHWVGRDAQPMAQGLCTMLATLGLCAAWRWWRLHTGPKHGGRLWRRTPPMATLDTRR